jgi:hypothetical protein
MCFIIQCNKRCVRILVGGVKNNKDIVKDPNMSLFINLND